METETIKDTSTKFLGPVAMFENVHDTQMEIAAIFPTKEDLEHELDDAVIENLKTGVLEKLLPDLRRTQQALAELTENQRILIETVNSENAKFGECQALTDVTDVMDRAKYYHAKLVTIKKDMTILHEKSAKLKKRALKLQQQRQKEALQKEQNRERELEKERQLIAKPMLKQHSSEKL